MSITTDGLESVAYLMSSSGTAPSHMAIGTGSSVEAIGDTALLTESDRNAFTALDRSTSQEVMWTADFSSTEISGTNLQEFGIFNAGAGGNLFHRTVIGSITFSGDRELQIQSVIRIT